MKRNILFNSCTAAMLVLSAVLPAAFAQDNGSETNQLVTLRALVDEALKKNPELRVASATIASAKGEVITANTRPNPEIGFAPGMKHITEGNDAVFSGAIEATQVIEYPGKRELRRAIAERNVTAGKLALQGLRYQIELQVRKAYFDLLAAQQIENLRSEQVKAAQIFTESVRKRIQAGYASDFEAIKSEADLITSQRSLREAQGKIAAASTTLNSLVGRPANTQIKVVGTNDGNTTLAITNVLQFALLNNPALHVQRVQLDKARLNVKASILSKRPDFTIGPSFEIGQDEQIFRFGVSVPLPIFNKRTGEIQTARAEHEKANAEIDRLQFEIVRAVKVAEENLRTARAELALYTPEFLNRLKTLVQQAEKSYAQSATTLLIYLDARRTYFDALASYNEALAKVAAARADLESAVGVPLDSTISQP
jgi:cobalt-zinc-cadmium efflux system outer membrane protein